MADLEKLLDSIDALAAALPADIELPASIAEFQHRQQTATIMVATPTLDGKVEGRYLVSALETAHVAKARGYQIRFVLKPHCVYLPMVRSKLVTEFMESDATDLFFIDADQGWDPEGFLRVMARDEDIVGGVPPLKNDSGAFPGLLATDAVGNPLVNPATGLIEAVVLGTGFLRIKRAAIERFLDHYGRDALTVVERAADGSERARYWNVFDTRHDGTTWYGEDVFFGNQWRAMGGKLWIEPDITFTHTGGKTWEGNLHDYLRALPGGGGNAPAHWAFTPRAA